MPIYEYEPVDWDCAICRNRLEVLQSAREAALSLCPTCGLEVRRLVSRAQVAVARAKGSDRAAEKGLTTFRRVERGKWEKVAGPGVDMIVGSEADMAAVDAEAKRKPIVDLDQVS
jgi:putative FmdB family regulatory protein